MLRGALDEYQDRLATWSATHRARARDDERMAAARLATAGGAVLLAVLAYRGHLSGWWLLAPAFAFVVLIKRHDRILRTRDEAARLMAFYDRGIARLEDRWAGTGEPGERFLDDEHPYASDLDLFGRGSLFELLSLARTRAGEETVAAWLKHPASAPELRDRHDAVRELRTALRLREMLAVAGTDVRAGVHPESLVAWSSAPPASGIAGQRLLAVILTVTFIALIAAAILTGWISLLVAAFACRAIYHQWRGEEVEAFLQRADSVVRDLDVLRAALNVLERESFESPSVARLQGALRASGVRASAAIGVLHRYVEMHDWAHNVVFTPVAAMLMWTTHLAWAIERWRVTHGTHVREWLRVIGEFEALSSLAAYAYEHPDDPLPEIVEATPLAGVFDGAGLGHPLLPAAHMVRNDVHLGGGTQLLVLSGSNMSGKSTLLRTVGINTVLALAGAPVRATSLRISPVAIGATLRIQDSLQQGRSRFYAEITRVRRLSDLAAERPLLFLLDELFHGTNSHDRLVGATGVLRHLVDRGAIGLVTTHDLALTAVTADFGGRAANVHFEDWFDGREMRFDYRMKPGPVTRSNAIALMRAVGLEVEEK